MGQLWVVGLGPGTPALLTGEARMALERAAVIVGYRAYVDQVRPWRPEALYRAWPIGAERARAREAVELAATGQPVALVSSGDAGVYGMAGLALEEWERLPPPRRPALAVLPGVTALLAAAALLGAPLGTDFAAVSLSDLLVPWPTIARRLEAAAAADFVLALYNPASAARSWQLSAACAILLRHRPATTPVGLVRAAYREGQHVAIVALGELAAQPVDMLTILIVGNRATRRCGPWLLTPRGYQRDTPAGD
ncbi:MAG TPA: precorrin-3B C(17)-methyltransferase [Chloroflexota bacterium]|jgi:cobalt-precorrin 5A hydrolase/precorrin-3B C17-methyltransferase|nr:precorrin-3B C(17)-methyltransferase [Chloroflexota bacterium]